MVWWSRMGLSLPHLFKRSYMGGWGAGRRKVASKLGEVRVEPEDGRRRPDSWTLGL